MTPLQLLDSLDLLSWEAVFIGFKKHWMTRNDVIHYAIERIEKDNNEDAIQIVVNQEALNDEAFIGFIPVHTASINERLECNKWRLAYLLAIEDLNSDQAKLEKLQEVYADFDYPDDMSACSMYSTDRTSPMAAMMDVIEKLKMEFLVR